MSSDLVKKLRDDQTIAETLPHWPCDNLQATMHAAADRIEALQGEVERLRAALKAIAVRAGTFEGRGSYIAYVELAGEIEKMADAARNGEEP